MKRLSTIIVIVAAVGFAGYALGRLTAPMSPAAVPSLTVGKILPAEFPPVPAAPKTPPEAANEPVNSVDANLIVETPVEQASVSGPFDVTGRAKGNATVGVEFQGKDGTVIWRGEATMPATDEYGRFSLTVPADPALTGAYDVVVTRTDLVAARSDTLRREVVFGIPDAVTVQVFLERQDEAGQGNCDQVVGVNRLVSSRDSIYRAALAELLKGPTDDERTAGLVSSLPSGITVKSVAADAQGTVTADFSAALDKHVAGSCRVMAIRTQIERTLRQFPEVRGVVIAVDGRTEDVLQP